MDGQRLFKWVFCGSLVAGTVGCNRNEVQSPWGTPPAVQQNSGMPMMSNGKKPFWGNTQTELPVEVSPEVARKGPATPDTLVAIADLRLEAALDENTPSGNRESMLDQARQGYQQALQQDQKHDGSTLGLARYYARIGEREKATEMYERFMSRHPNDRDVPHEVAIAHARWKDWSAGVSWCERALKADPENITFRKTMAFCLARSGRWEEAFALFCQMMPEAQARYNMARVLGHQNHPEACKQQLELAVKADPSFGPARDFLAGIDESATPIPRPGQDPNGIQRAGHVEQPQ